MLQRECQLLADTVAKVQNCLVIIFLPKVGSINDP
jgi:hypothetical protein